MPERIKDTFIHTSYSNKKGRKRPKIYISAAIRGDLLERERDRERGKR